MAADPNDPLSIANDPIISLANGVEPFEQKDNNSRKCSN